MQLQAGEISKLEMTLAESRLLQSKKEVEDLVVLERKAFLELSKTAYLAGQVTLQERTYEALPFPYDWSASSIWLDPFEQQIRVNQRATALQKDMIQPEFSLGYFNQSIRPDYAYQGVLAGVAIPFWKKNNKAKVEAAELQEQIAYNHFEWQKRNLLDEQNIIWQAVVNQYKQLQEFGTELSQQRELILEISLEQMENGEIDYFKYLQSLNIALENEIQLLELVYRYNKAVLEWKKLNG